MSGGEEGKGSTRLKCDLCKAILGPNTMFFLCLPLTNILPEQQLKWVNKDL